MPKINVKVFLSKRKVQIVAIGRWRYNDRVQTRDRLVMLYLDRPFIGLGI